MMGLRFCSLAFLSLGLVMASAGAEQNTGANLVAAARDQIGKTIFYDPTYYPLAYPGGDPPLERGVCSDVVIRAFRAGLHVDLQETMHRDMAKAFSDYPHLWGLSKTDSNIDHRRVPNLRTYFKRMGYSLPVDQNPGSYLPGDIVTCIVPPNLPHIMIVSDRKSASGVPLVIHNIGQGTQEEDRLFQFELTGHYRIKEAH